MEQRSSEASPTDNNRQSSGCKTKSTAPSRDANTTREGPRYKTGSGKIETEHDTFTDCRRRRGRMTNYHALASSSCSRKTVYLNKLGEHFRISPAIRSFSVVWVWRFGYFRLVFSYAPNNPTTTWSHPLIGNGGKDLPPASFSSLCYFQMQPTGRGSWTDVGYRPFGGGQASDGNSLEAQIPNLTAESKSLIQRANDVSVHREHRRLDFT